jgi:hypothetical protein
VPTTHVVELEQTFQILTAHDSGVIQVGGRPMGTAAACMCARSPLFLRDMDPPLPHHTCVRSLAPNTRPSPDQHCRLTCPPACLPGATPDRCGEWSTISCSR